MPLTKRDFVLILGALATAFMNAWGAFDPTSGTGSTVVNDVTWYYTLKDGQATIVPGDIPYAGDLVVPSTVDGYPVVELTEGCFHRMTGVTSVVVPEGVVTLGSGVFARNPNLTRVVLPDSATNLVESCFYECKSLTECRLPKWLPMFCRMMFKETAMTEITVPEGVTFIGDCAFYLSAKMECVTLPETVEMIDWGAFHSCASLKSIEFPAGFKTFGVYNGGYSGELHAVFGNCVSLKTAIFNGALPANFNYSWLIQLGCKIYYPRAYAASWAAAVPAASFGGYTEDKGWESLPPEEPASEIGDGKDVIDGVTWYYTLKDGQATIVPGDIPYAGDLVVPTMVDGYPVVELTEGCFHRMTGVTSVVVPEGVVTLGSGVFARNPNLTRVVLPDSATNLVESCFYECRNLTECRLPKWLPTFCRMMFKETAMTEITVPEGATFIGDCAFYLSTKLERVTLPETLVMIDWGAFHTCSSLKSIEFPAAFRAFGVYNGGLSGELHAVFGQCTSLEKAIFHGPVPRNFASSWLDKLGCKIFYPKAYADDWAAVVPAEIFGGYTDDIGKDPVGPEPGPDPAIVDEITVGAVAERYAAGMEIEPIAIAYTGAAEKAKLTVTGLPEGLAFGNGVIAGAPDLPGVYTVVATVKAGSVVLATKSLTLTVANYADQLASGLEDAYGPFIPGEPLVLDLVPVAGWKAAQALPAGLSFNAKTGRLSGTPKKPGVCPLVFTKKVGFALHAASTLLTIAPLRKVALVAEGEGTVKGAGAYLANARVTLTAKAAKGFALLGWFSSGELVSRDASFAYTVGVDEVQTLVAKFVTVAEDRSSVRAALAGEALDAETALVVTNYQGVALSLPLACEALTKPTVGVSGLPSGLSFKNGVIAGAPQTASALDKKTLAYKPKTAKVTVKTLAGTTAKYAIDFVTLPRPAWAAGSYDGVYAVAGAPAGRITATLGANGKLSGKVAMTVEGKAVTATLTAANLAAYDAGTEKFQIVATVTAKKLFEETVTFTLGAREENGAGLLTAGDESAMFVAAQNVWQEKSFTAPALPTGKRALTLALEEGLALKFGAKGVVTFAGSLAGTGGTPVSVSGTAQLVVTGDGEAAVVLYAAPKKGLPNGYLREILIDFTVNDENVVTGIAKR